MSAFIDAVLKALDAEEQKTAIDTGRGKYGTGIEAVNQRIGIAKGLAKAQEIVREAAKRAAAQESDA